MISATNLLQLIILLFITLIPSVLAFFLAKDKGRNVALWTVLGLIPFLNLVFLLYFLSATNLRLEDKLSEQPVQHHESSL